MSSKKPEVGDVWLDTENKKCKITFLCLIGENDVLLHFDYLNKENRLREGMAFADTIIKNWKYLGKSKASIRDLFEVE